jgi:hypothetical protein
VDQIQEVAGSEKGDGGHASGLDLPRIIALLLLALVVYVLSTGPVIKLCLVSNKRVPKVIDVMYKPLEFCYHNCGPVRNFFDWYFQVCGVK